ncbi:MAG: hypothetical protein ACJ75B_12270 [Flavisolibacter sp.]
MANKHHIPLADAKKMIRNFKDKKEQILAAPYKKAGSLPISETFDRSAFDQVLAKPGCVGLRVYFAMDDNMQIRVVIVGVNENNEDMITNTQAKSASASTLAASDTTTDPTNGDIIEQGTRCPDVCPPDSPLTTP